MRAAFLHDIGKAIDREMEGTHLQLGIDFLRKHGESEAVVMAMAAHHMDIDWPSLEAMIVQAADAISAARPGARRDILESYVKRLEKLEGIADSFKGVSKSFALQAGREIRIMVESEKISDEEAVWLSKDIARRIENELEYPGPDQGDGHPRNARGRLREVTRAGIRLSIGQISTWPARSPTPNLSLERGGARRARAHRAHPGAPPAPAWLRRRHRRRCGGRRAGAERARGPHVDASSKACTSIARSSPPAAIGHRALAVNLSDLAAMGAAPRLALLSLVLPPALPVADFDALLGGLLALAGRERALPSSAATSPARRGR